MWVPEADSQTKIQVQDVFWVVSRETPLGSRCVRGGREGRATNRCVIKHVNTVDSCSFLLLWDPRRQCRICTQNSSPKMRELGFCPLIPSVSDRGRLSGRGWH